MGSVLATRRFAAGVAIAATITLPGAPQAATLTTLHAFTGGADGATPYKGISRDAAGNLYGVTFWGADDCTDSAQYTGVGCGTLWKIDTAGTFSVLITFTGSNGASPDGNLTLSAGNILGTTWTGGADNQGTVFRVSAAGQNFKTLHSFTGADGQHPDSYPRLDSSGNIFSITQYGGPAYVSGQDNSGYGVLFELRRGSNAYVAQHDFSGGADGGLPGRIFLDANGNIFGSTASGGACSGSGLPAAGCGVVYEFTPLTAQFQVLYTFTGTSDGYNPELGGFDKNGNLYGATIYGGANGDGTLFELTPNGAGGYTYAHLYDFRGKLDGAEPINPFVSPTGLLTGTTEIGPVTKAGSGAGVLYQYRPGGTAHGLYVFDNGATGGYPFGTPLVVGTTIYGVTSYGGPPFNGTSSCYTSGGTLISTYGCGTVFQYQP